MKTLSAAHAEVSEGTYFGIERPYGYRPRGWHQYLRAPPEDQLGEFFHLRCAGTAYRNDWNLVARIYSFLVPHGELGRDAHSVSWAGQTWPASWVFYREGKLTASVSLYALAPWFSA